MSSPSQEISRFATTLYIKGALMLGCGILALAWADAAMVHAMMFAALLLAIAGLYELALAWVARKAVRGWPLAFADGAASVGFAMLTVTVTAIPLRATMLLTAVWLLLYAALACALALALWPMPRTRVALLAWMALDIMLAGLAVFFTGATIFDLLYAGAAFAIAYGTFQIAAGWWLRRVAVPQFAPTIQASWISIGM